MKSAFRTGGKALLLVFVFFAVLFYREGLMDPLIQHIRGRATVSQRMLEIREVRDIPFEAADWDRLLIYAMKEERMLELWARNEGEAAQRLRQFPFTGYSGKLGPKLREGDRQIPEGLYEIASLNPNSAYHLSLEVSYPNAFDRQQGERDQREALGGEIFIHGGTLTVGCIPLGDDAVEELFLIVAEMGISRVELILSPYDMRAGLKPLQIEGIDWEQELYGQIARATLRWFPPEED